MKTKLPKWSLILLCFSMAAAIGGGLFEHIVLVPLWSKSPPSSFAIIQPNTGVPLQNFWIPVHAAITIFIISSLILTWRERKIRRLQLIGLSSYIVMRAWSGIFFIREMLAFQKVPLDSSPTPELSARVSSWIFWSWFREPLDIITFLCCLLALYWLKRPEEVRTEMPMASSEAATFFGGVLVVVAFIGMMDSSYVGIKSAQGLTVPCGLAGGCQHHPNRVLVGQHLSYNRSTK